MKAISSAIIAASGVLSVTACAFLDQNKGPVGPAVIFGGVITAIGLGSWIHYVRDRSGGAS